MNLPKKVHIVEMCPRDGFQGEKTMIPTEKKIQFINMLSRTGLNDIQATSLVHPKAIPQLADGDEVLAKIDRPAGVQWKVLVPNLRGLERSFPYKPDKINLMMSVSESHSRANANKSVDEALKGHAEVAKAALDAGIGVIGQMSCFFGCPFEGEVPLVPTGEDHQGLSGHGRPGTRTRRHHWRRQPTADVRSGLPRHGHVPGHPVLPPHAQHSGHGTR